MPNGWLDKVLEYSKESESPSQYFYWAGLAALAGVVRNKVYLDKFYYKLYPNLYILLIGKSGIRKGIPVALAKELVNGAKVTRVISGRASIQKVISELATAHSTPGGLPILDAIGYFSSSEFASFIIQDQQALTILTDLYDGHYHADGWANMTKVSGNEKLKNICLTLFGASNEVHFKEAVPDNALGGGFIARTVIVYADKKNGVNSLTHRPKQSLDILELSDYINKVKQVEGEFTWSEDGRDLYDKWYTEFSGEVNNDDTGTLERIHDTVLKIAMLVSLSRKLDLVLEKEDIAEALEQARRTVPGLKRLVMGAGKNPLGPQTAMVLKELLTRPPTFSASKSEILTKYWGHLDSYDLDRIAESLQQQKAIKVSEGGGDTYYILNPKVAESFFKGKS
jgi:hypothetical protein